MSSRNNELQYIELLDFSAGIWDDQYNSTHNIPAPNGAAQTSGTFGCVVGDSGQLMPGPSTSKQLTQTLFDSPMDAAHYPDLQVRIIGSAVLSPTYRSTITTDDTLCLLHAYWWDAGGTGVFANSRYKLVAQLYSTNTGSFYTIATRTSGINPASFPLYGPGSVDTSRAQTAIPTNPGHPIFCVVGYNVADSTLANNMAVVYPAQATIGANSSDNIMGGFPNAPQWVFAHQDRLTFVGGSPNDQACGTNTIPAETILFSNVNDYTTISPSVVYVSENPAGFGSFLTQNASTAVLVKRNLGGYFISGPLEQPTITRLPGIPGADPPNLPARNIDGTVVYGNRQGIWAWGGGDTAQLISRQLPPGFWINGYGRTGGATQLFYDPSNWKVYPSLAARFCFMDPYVWVSNNWLYDTRFNSWWRINSPNNTTAAYYSQYLPTSDGRVIAIPYAWTGTNNQVADYYDYNTYQNTYTWTSQPLQESVNRELSFRELNVTTQGSTQGGTLMFTFTDLNGTIVGTTPIINVNTSNRAYTQSIPIGHINAHDLIVSFVATGNSGSAAPMIHRIVLGYEEEETAR